jgi:hypothetical protein
MTEHLRVMKEQLNLQKKPERETTCQRKHNESENSENDSKQIDAQTDNQP